MVAGRASASAVVVSRQALSFQQDSSGGRFIANGDGQSTLIGTVHERDDDDIIPDVDDITPVPEPASSILFATGVIGVGVVCRSKSKKSSP